MGKEKEEGGRANKSPRPTRGASSRFHEVAAAGAAAAGSNKWGKAAAIERNQCQKIVARKLHMEHTDIPSV